ncbi:hypothetical protein GCM10010191_74570 [Actinomadura vinacea]|uniref:TIR domain-containing protein n=1 Tax=Actinomadura vinacea TaxID=115336 RepID=A0ABN3K4E1_9ACTN
MGETGRPRVFLCHAAADHAAAVRLGRDLAGHGIGVISHEHNIGPGENIVLATNRALTQSDYFVLLWSHATEDLPWIDEVWTAAFARGQNEQRRFLFVLRLDRTPPPVLLAARPHLDAFAGWDEAVAELVATWNRDRVLGHPVLPAPFPSHGEGPTIAVYVRNRALEVAHVVRVPERTTAQDAFDRVRSQLALPGKAEVFGKVGMDLGYRLMRNGTPLPDKPLDELGVTDGSVLDLEITIKPFGLGDTATSVIYLSVEPADVLPPALLRMLTNAAFGHLKPWR